MKFKKGQLLLEILFAITIGAVVLSLGAGLVYVGLRGSDISSERGVALGVMDEMTDAIKLVAFENWESVYFPPETDGSKGDDADDKGTGVKYYTRKLAQYNADEGYLLSGIYLNETPASSSDRWGTTATVTATSSIENQIFIGTSNGKL